MRRAQGQELQTVGKSQSPCLAMVERPPGSHSEAGKNRLPQVGPLTSLPGKQYPTEGDFRDRWVIKDSQPTR